MTIIASFSSIDASLWKSFERVKWNLKCEEMIEKRAILIYPDLDAFKRKTSRASNKIASSFISLLTVFRNS